MSDKAHVRRRDIKIEERQEFIPTFKEDQVLSTGWEARIDGPLSTGETVCMDRYGGTAATALGNLEKAIAEQGWSIMPERVAITPEYLTHIGPPSISSVAEGIIAVISGDGAETIDLTFDQAEGLAARLAELARG